MADKELLVAIAEADIVAKIKTYIPAGATGPKGAPGAKGAKGDQGTVGPAGAKGAKGDVGPAGTITPADQAKVDFITVGKAINLDTTQDNVQVALNRITALGLAPDAQTKITQSVNDVQVPKQTIPGTPTLIEKDNRLITVANAYEIEAALKQYSDAAFATKAELAAPREIYALVGNNPTMKMEVEDAGLAAQMQVLDKKANRAVASMEWIKATQTFSFTLFDKSTGVVKATFEIKPDGKAYIGGHEVATHESVEKLIHEFRVTVVHNIADHAKPTAAECATVFKTLPHFDWKKDDDFYIKDSTGGKLVLIKYRSTPAATEAAPGNFFYEVLTAAK